MRAVVQRVTAARLSVDGQLISEIKSGLLVFLGLEKGDGETDLAHLADKIINLRIFSDQEGKMNLSLADTGGDLLLVSQFTLLGDVRRGRRPGFDAAMSPQDAAPFFERVVRHFSHLWPKTKTGVFGADMKIEAHNDGPVTILLDSKKTF